MSRRHIWKNRFIASRDDYDSLLSVWQYAPRSSRTHVFECGRGWVETNLPWRDLASLFHAACVPLCRDQWVTSPTRDVEEEATCPS